MVASHEITEDEAALYDRQIRLWGLDAQKRLRGARVIVIGVSGLGAEVCKNIVLAGINKLTMLDDATVTEQDFTSNFLIPRDQLGKNRASACLSRVQQLNPMVTVTVDTDSLDSKDEAYFSGFDVMCATGCTRKQLFSLNLICRELGIQFYCGEVAGFIGFMFADLQQHEYAEEQLVDIGKTEDSDSDEPAAKKKKSDPETKMVKSTAEFTSLRDALEVDWCSDKYSKRVKRVEPTFFLMQALQKFHESEGRRPACSSKAADIELLNKFVAEVVTEASLPDGKLGTKQTSSVFGELSPVCAVVGGVLAQEIIKAVSHKDQPINNFFFYNAVSGNGVVQCIGD